MQLSSLLVKKENYIGRVKIATHQPRKCASKAVYPKMDALLTATLKKLYIKKGGGGGAPSKIARVQIGVFCFIVFFLNARARVCVCVRACMREILLYAVYEFHTS